MPKMITRIKEYRAKNNMKQEELAQLIGVRRETIGHLENGNGYSQSFYSSGRGIVSIYRLR